MAVHAAGSPLTMTQIVAEFSGPYNLSSHVRGGAYVPNGPPQNAAISTTLSNLYYGAFYGSVKSIVLSITISASTYNVNLRNLFISAGWDGVTPGVFTVNNSFTIGSTTVGAFALDTGSMPASTMLYINNTGFIEGKGGDAVVWNGVYYDVYVGVRNGGPAINLQCNCQILNTSGYIGGGGGAANLGGGGAGFNIGIGAVNYGATVATTSGNNGTNGNQMGGGWFASGTGYTAFGGGLGQGGGVGESAFSMSSDSSSGLWGVGVWFTRQRRWIRWVWWVIGGGVPEYGGHRMVGLVFSRWVMPVTGLLVTIPQQEQQLLKMDTL